MIMTTPLRQSVAIVGFWLVATSASAQQVPDIGFVSVGRAATLKLVAVGEADENGVCVVPQDRTAEVLEFARLFKSIEDGIVEAVRSGVDPVEAHDRVRYDMMTKAGYKA